MKKADIKCVILGVACVCVLLAAGGCRRAPVSEDGQVLATVGRAEITVGDFKRAMLRRGGGFPDAFADEKKRNALLDELIEFETLAELARSAGYFEDPEVVRAWKQMAIDHYQRGILERSGAQLEVSGSELTNYFKAHATQFTVPERLRAAVIHVRVPEKTTAAKRAELRARAEEARAEALQLDAATRHFGSLAARFSDDQATRYKGGDAGWITREARFQRWTNTILDAISRLTEPGAVSAVLEDDKGYYVFRLMERQPAHPIAFEIVRENLRQKMTLEKQDRLLSQAIAAEGKEIRVTRKTDLLKTITSPPAPRRIAPLPPGMPK